MKEISSKALELNIAEYRVDVTIDPRYSVIQEVMSKYEGLHKPLNTFLEELCHPRKNWQFIVDEARKFSLGYFYDLKTHDKGPEAVRLYIEIAVEAIENAKSSEVRMASYSNLYLIIQKFIRESDDKRLRFMPVINGGFRAINDLSPKQFALISRSYYQLNRLASSFLESAPAGSDCTAINSLLIRFFEYSIDYWFAVEDPGEWFAKEVPDALPDHEKDLFKPILSSSINKEKLKLSEIAGQYPLNSSDTLSALLELTGFGNFVQYYGELPDRLYQSVENEKYKHRCKLVFLFHTMNIQGLASIHEETLREINRDITWLISHAETVEIQRLIETTIRILQQSVDKYPATVLKTVFNLGKGVYETNESDLVYFFNKRVVKLGFQTPDFRGISDDWQIKSNHSHIQNIRAWMELIELHPKWSRKLLSALIIHLSLSGVLIKDTDLFPRDITSFLNSDIRPVYNLCKQLMKLFPAYYNEIGAEGKLRDVSTSIDEICQRKDSLIHFLRKQSHVESSNKIIALVEATITFWKTKSKDQLKAYLPPNIYESIETSGQYIDGVNYVMNIIGKERDLADIVGLLSLEDSYLSGLKAQFPDQYSVDAERVSLLVTLYKVLNEKYCITSCKTDNFLVQAESTIPLNIKALRNSLALDNKYKKLSGLLDFLDELKKIILSPDHYDIQEDIYRKRHIAVDIPSMYGSYREAKFDALGLSFRLEAVVNKLFEELIDDFDLSFITHATFYRIYEYLCLFNRALQIDGIPMREFEEQLVLLNKSLDIKVVTYTQYLDIFRGFTRVVRNIVSNYFSNAHKENLMEISDFLPDDKLLMKYASQSGSRQELFHKVSEIFLRDIIASSFGIQRLDLFLTRIVHTLNEQAEKLPVDKHHLLISYNPRNVVTSIEAPYADLKDIIHLGNKSFNIMKMKDIGLPVPPGFVVTTEVFSCRELIESYLPARTNFREQVDREVSRLEHTTGRVFGAPGNALLLSVRSGAAVSQPGMLDSYLNVGMNEEIVAGIIQQTGEEWFPWDSYRRFLQSYGMSFGLERNSFDRVINEFKTHSDVSLKKDLSSEQMKEVAMAYKELIRSRGINIAESPKEQLYIAIGRVLNSWDSDKARVYRKIIGISDNWGTAVTIQKMVFGNISAQSGSGVLFTHSPKFRRDVLRLWGDYTIGNQGEDVVSGLVNTYPISNYQARYEHRPSEHTLENRFPEIYHTLRKYAKVMIYDHLWAPQDIEFTFEGPHKTDLYLLQTRNMEMKERKGEPVFVNTDVLKEKLMGHGIGVSGGALSGRAVFNLEDISQWRNTEPETDLILIRNDTVPDDIKEISEADGLLTARGGATSHASIVATSLGKTCVVGCMDLLCMEKDKKFTLDNQTVSVGDFISINGLEGSVYLGKIETGKERG